MKKILIFIIIVLALLGLYFVYNYLTKPITNAPAGNENGVFKGPSGQPSVKGPTRPPPER